MAGACIRGVVVTRPVGRGRALTRALSAHGYAVASLPGSSIGAPADVEAARRGLRAAQSADRVIFVSPTAVAWAFRLCPALAFRGATIVLAPGPGTRAALARRGLPAAVPTARYDSEGLLALPALRAVDGLRIVLVGAPGGRDLLARTLAGRGARVESVAVYARRPARLDRRHLARFDTLSGPIASCWSSAEAVGHVLGALTPERRRRLARGLAVASSARIAEALAARGFRRVTRAASASPRDLVAAVLAADSRPEIATDSCRNPDPKPRNDPLTFPEKSARPA